MKGYPIQVAAVDALNSLFEAAAIKNRPPISYDKDDIEFTGSGGPRIFPSASWPTLGDIKVHTEIGDPAAMFAIYQGLLQQYADVTGTTAPRLGAQTVSHTTAFAKTAGMTCSKALEANIALNAAEMSADTPSSTTAARTVKTMISSSTQSQDAELTPKPFVR